MSPQTATEKLRHEEAGPPFDQGGAPEPVFVHAGRPTISRLAGVLRWLAREKRYPISPELLELAEATVQVNLAVEARDADPRSQARIAALLA